MDTLNFSTPGLLFPAISLLMLAYTNRFLGLAGLVRGLIEKHRADPSTVLTAQIENLTLRLQLLRHIQALGVTSLLVCTLSLFAVFMGWQVLASVMFALSLVTMAISLLLSLVEVHLSVRALGIELATIQDGG